jgi:hypothetical protein
MLPQSNITVYQQDINRRMSMRGMRRIVTMLAVAVTGVGVLLTLSGSATAAGLPSAHPAATQNSGYGWHEVAQDGSIVPMTSILGHRCANFGTDGLRRGGHCAEVAWTSSGSRLEVWAHGQGFCQVADTGYIVHCLGIQMNPQLYFVSGSTAVLAESGHAGCGVYSPGVACPPDGSRFNVASPHEVTYGYVGECITFFSYMYSTRMRLPVSGTYIGPASIDSSNVYLCYG